jgi:hypothetical protein
MAEVPAEGGSKGRQGKHHRYKTKKEVKRKATIIK